MYKELLNHYFVLVEETVQNYEAINKRQVIKILQGVLPVGFHLVPNILKSLLGFKE